MGKKCLFTSTRKIIPSIKEFVLKIPDSNNDNQSHYSFTRLLAKFFIIPLYYIISKSTKLQKSIMIAISSMIDAHRYTNRYGGDAIAMGDSNSSSPSSSSSSTSSSSVLCSSPE